MKKLIEKYILTAKGLGSLGLLAVIAACAWNTKPLSAVALSSLCWVALIFIHKYAK